MKLHRFDKEQAMPLEGGTDALVMPLKHDGRTLAMLVHLDRKGDTGKREVDVDILLTVVSGAGQARSGPHAAELQAGDVVVLPAGNLHSIWASGSEMLIILQTLQAEQSE